MQVRARRNQRPAALALLAAGAGLLLAWAGQHPVGADVSGVTASAFGYSANVGFNDEEPMVLGFGQTIPPGTLQSASPSVDCPAAGTSDPVVVTDPDGALATYGSRAVFSGQWPENATAPPPSGPLTVSCQGATGPTGSASSAADVYNVGPGPLLADEVHSTCTASETGVTAATTIIGGVLVASTDADGKPVITEPIPLSPDPNTMRNGTIDDVGDTYRIILNEQIEDPVTGALTVNAVHIYFLGPFTEGDVIIGSSTCGVAVVAATTTTEGQTTTTAGDTTTTTQGTTTTTQPATTTTTRTTDPQPGEVPAVKDECKDGGFTRLGFKNQGECAKSVPRSGKT